MAVVGRCLLGDSSEGGLVCEGTEHDCVTLKLVSAFRMFEVFGRKRR